MILLPGYAGMVLYKLIRVNMFLRHQSTLETLYAATTNLSTSDTIRLRWYNITSNQHAATTSLHWHDMPPSFHVDIV